MNRRSCLVILAASAFGVFGCGSGTTPTASNAAAGDEIGAKTLGIETPTTVQHVGGAYQSDIGFAKSIVGSQRKAEESHAAQIQSLTTTPH